MTKNKTGLSFLWISAVAFILDLLTKYIVVQRFDLYESVNLYIRVPSRSSREYAKVVNLLGIFDGDMPVLLYLTDTKQYLRVPRHLYASGHPLLFKELERLVGTDNIATK